MTKHLADLSNAEIFLRGHFGEDDGILLSADRSPNLRGALVTELIQKYPEDNLHVLDAAITNGDVEVLFVMNEDLIQSGISEENLAKVKVIYIGTHTNSSSQNAEVVLPGLSVFEKAGSFINRSFLIQAFEVCVPSPIGLKSQLEVLSAIISGLSNEDNFPIKLDSIWKLVNSGQIDLLSSITYTDVKKSQIQLDGSRWSNLCFVEKEALNFIPLLADYMFDWLPQNVWFSVGLKIFFALMMIGAVMTMAGYSVLAERKVSAWMQGRVGPNRTALPFIDYIPIIGPFLRKLEFFQPLADGLKFLFKEEIVPGHVNKFYYYLAPLVALVPALTTMTVLPFGQMYWSTVLPPPLLLLIWK